MDVIGKMLGEYRVNSLLGHGGMGEVYKAYDPTVNRFVAIKIMLPRYSVDEEFRVRFDREALLIAGLEHVHILPLYAYGEQDNLLYLVVRFMSGGSLSAQINEGGPLPFGDITRMLAEMASALDYAHGKGVLHRDFKTDNVLLDSNANTYLSDFGLATMLSGASHLTGNMIVGTPSFMSPEQSRGRKDLTPASDQYALGMVLYHMITGIVPFQDDEPLAVLQMQINDLPPSPRQYREDLPEIAERVIYRALDKDPAKRFPDCLSLARAFADAVAGAGLKRLNRIPDNLRHRINTALADMVFDDEDEE